jgi:hypothetical protein
MNYLILINGEVKGPFQIEKLVEEGVSKRTRVCIDGAEEWFIAEDVRALDTIWEPKKVVSTEVIEIQGKETPAIVTEVVVESPEVVIIDKEKDPPGLDIKKMLLIGGGIIILFFGIYWAWDNWITKPTRGSSSSEGTISKVDTIQSIETDKPLLKLYNPQKEYENLINEGIIDYNNDNLPKALEIFLQAQIVRNDNSLKISNNAKSTYKTAIDKGNVLFGNGLLKQVIPLAEIHFKIAEAINPTSEIKEKIEKCQSIQ